MSSYAHNQTQTTPEELAQAIDLDFQTVADKLPVDVKTAPAGQSITLCQIEGLGRLSASYMGQRYLKTGNAISQFSVRLVAQAEGYDGQLGYTKDFALTYATLRAHGPLTDLQPTTVEDFEGCSPEFLGELGFVVSSLCEEYGRIRKV